MLLIVFMYTVYVFRRYILDITVAIKELPYNVNSQN